MVEAEPITGAGDLIEQVGSKLVPARDAGGSDVIDLRGFGFFNSLQSRLSFQPSDVAVITIDADTVLTIANGIPPNGFLASDFIF